MRALWQLFLMRMRTYLRDPGTLFWIFLFPMVTSFALGLAFREPKAPRLPVGVVRGEGSEARLAVLRAEAGLEVRPLEPGEVAAAVRKGEVALALLPGEAPGFAFDPVRPESRTARLEVLRALERSAGRLQPLPYRDEPTLAQGSRYIDFLIPGMLGFNLMSSGIWGVGYTLATMRKGKVLKRLAATPMRQSSFLASFLLSRLALALVEMGFFILFARLLFQTRMNGSLWTFVFLGVLGALTFACLALLVGSRTENTETAGGLANLVVLPMTMLSGVFFTVQRWPPWLQPWLRLLPLTALNDSLRGVMNDGFRLTSLGQPLAVLVAWAVLSFALALRLFRWT